VGEEKIQKDLAPCLSSKKVKTIFGNTKLSMLDWPWCSPDLNPLQICDQ